MKMYTTGPASGKLNKPATLKIFGTTKTRSEIAKALHGDINGEWINIRGPVNHSSNDRSLGVVLDIAAPDGFRVHSFAGDNIAECRAHVKTLLNAVSQGGSLFVENATPLEFDADRRARIARALANGEDPGTMTAFGSMLSQRGFHKKKSNKISYSGIALKPLNMMSFKK
jgi:hypothetical protein